MALQGDVAEAGGGQRRDGEIERIGIVGDFRIDVALGLVDDAVITKMKRPRLRAAMMVCSFSRKRRESRRMRARTSGERMTRSTLTTRRNARPSPAMGASSETMTTISARLAGFMRSLRRVSADPEARQEIGEDDEADDDVDHADDRRMPQEGRDDEKYDGPI